MERLFSSCTRYRDIVESQGGRHRFREWGPELNLDVSTEELLCPERAFTYANLYAMLGNRNTIAWLTPHVAVAGEIFPEDVSAFDSTFKLNADGKGMYVRGYSPEHTLEICGVVLRLLAVSVAHSVRLNKLSSRAGALVNAPTLAYLMENCQSVKFLSLTSLEMDENHCRVLGAYSRAGLEIEMNVCKLTSAGTSALAELLGRNKGPTRLHRCHIDNFILADGLRGNNSLKSLRPHLSDYLEVRNRELLAIAGALRENKGLVDLDIWHNTMMSDETWGAICDSIKTHPTLEALNLTAGYDNVTLAPAVLKSRIQGLVDMVKINMSIRTIDLDFCYHQHELFRGSVIPYLLTNGLRPRVRAIQKNTPNYVPCQGVGKSTSFGSYRCK